MRRFNETGSIFIGHGSEQQNDDKEGWFMTRNRLIGRAAMLNRGTLIHYESHVMPVSLRPDDLQAFMDGTYDDDVIDLRAVLLVEPNSRVDNVIRQQTHHYFEATDLTGEPLTGENIAIESIVAYLAGQQNKMKSDDLVEKLVDTRSSFQNLSDAKFRPEPTPVFRGRRSMAGRVRHI